VVLLAVLALIQLSVASDDAHILAQNKIKLARTLAKDYEKLVNPGNTTLKIGLSFVCAHYDISEKRLNSRVFERYAWKDWRLTWDPKDYGDVKILKVPASLIWRPSDVRLINAFDESPERDDVNAIILSDGSVYWIVPTSYTTVCGPRPNAVKGEKKGHCHLSLGSWTFTAEEMPLVLFDGGADEKFYLDHCPHVMSNLNVHIKKTKYDCCPDPYPSLEVDFDLEERSDWTHHPSQESKQDKKSSRKLGVDCRWPDCLE